MTYVLIAQMGENKPRVTHHNSVEMARMELGVFITSKGYSTQSSVICVDMRNIPEVELNLFMGAKGCFFGVIELDEAKPYTTIVHVWTDNFSFKELRANGANSRAEAVDTLCRYILEEKEQAFMKEEGYLCYDYDHDEYGRLYVELYAIDNNYACDTQF